MDTPLVTAGGIAPERLKALREKAAGNPDHEVNYEAIAAAAAAEQRNRREATWNHAIPARFVDAHINDLDGEVRHLADEWDGTSNVLLLGNVGVGKTHAAVALARTVHDLADVLFRSSTRLLDELRPGGDEDALDRAVDVDVLILDDLGAERPTEWTAERLRLIVDERYNRCRPTLVTSNLSPDELEKAVGKRMWSRLVDGALRLKVAGDDRRRA